MLTRIVGDRAYNYLYCMGRIGTAGTAWRQPLDFALGSQNSIYVVNRGGESVPSQGISKYTLDHDFIWDRRGPGFLGGESPWPISVDLDGQENVYVCDEYTSRITIFDKDGDLQGGWGVKGEQDGELNGPSGLAFDQEGNLYVVDSMNHRVQKFTGDGKFLSTWGKQGIGIGEFNTPWGIGIDKAGNVYVADWGNDRVQKLTPDGEYVATFGSPGTGDGELRRPTAMAIDSEGDVYVTDWGNDRLAVYAPDGTFVTAFIGDADKLSPWAQGTADADPNLTKARLMVDLTEEMRFKRPVAVNVDDDGRIMVLEPQRARLQVYVKEKAFVTPPLNL